MDDDGKQRKAFLCDGVMDQDKTVISKIMQRFRPIAPKPVVGESTSEETKSSRFLGRNKRPKRKYVTVRNKNNSSGKDRISSRKSGCNIKNKKTDLDKEIDVDDNRSEIVTLQLLPEKDRDLGNNREHHAGAYCSDLRDMVPKTNLYGSIVELASSLDRTVVESWLTVECVSDTCTNLELDRMAQGDQERMMKVLEVDTCPWLVSNESNRVSWVNRAYRRMMGDSDAEEVIRVWLVVAMDLMEEITCMVELNGSVTCRVRVRNEPSTRRKESSEVKMTVPCDVLRLRSGGSLAWRLDVESALKLGL